MGIGNFGFSELLVVIVLVLIFFGPQRMPEIARGLGKAMREFRKGMNEVKRELEQAGMGDDSPPWKQEAGSRPAGTVEPPHVTAGGPPSGGPAPSAAEAPAGDAEAVPAEPAEFAPPPLAPDGAPAGASSEDEARPAVEAATPPAKAPPGTKSAAETESAPEADSPPALPEQPA